MKDGKSEKRVIDWEAIEPHYRAGILSLKEMGAQHGVSDAAIVKHAKRDGWSRDLLPRSTKKEKVILVAVDEMSAAGFVYVIYVDTGLERIYKLGMAKRFDARFDQHQCASPFDICVALCYFVGNMRAEERSLHAEFVGKRVRGEWFRLSANDLCEIAKRAVLV